MARATSGTFVQMASPTLVGSELSILGRKDEMFVSGGENIYPDEIERELNACAEVEMSIVVPVPDEEFGFRPAAVIRWADAKPREESVFRQLEKRLPKFKVPDLLIEWPDEMVEQGMKVSRSAVKKLVLKAWAKPR